MVRLALGGDAAVHALDDILDGAVVLYAVVETDGMVRQARVLRSLRADLDEKAMEAVKQWKFRPGTKEGKPVPVVASIEVTFRLDYSAEAAERYRRGKSYLDGDGVPRDYKEAVKWFRQAAENGNRDAQRALGMMYEQGQGVKQDYVLACMWFKLAANRGLADAAAAQSQLEKQMTAEQVARAEALARDWKRK